MPLIALLIDDSMLIRHTVGRFLEARGVRLKPQATAPWPWKHLKHSALT